MLEAQVARLSEPLPGSLEAWSELRKRIIGGFHEVAGPLPPRVKREKPWPRPTRPEVFPGFTRWHLELRTAAGRPVPTHLYLPDPAPGRSRRPAIVALHPTSPLGKLVVAGEGPRPNRAQARELAWRGYVVIAPDYPSFGELSKYDFSADDLESGTLAGLVHHVLCVDYLVERDDVDPERIGAIGHSLGGHNAIFLGAVDERVQAVVTSCGWTPFPDYRGGKLAGWTSERYLPAIRDEYDLDPGRVHFDFPGLIATLAPRAFFTSSPTRDDNFDVTGVRRAMPRLREIWKLLGKSENLRSLYPDSDHDFPPEARREAYSFLDHVLRFEPVHTTLNPAEENADDA